MSDKPELQLTPKGGDSSLILSPARSLVVARGRRDAAALAGQARPLSETAQASAWCDVGRMYSEGEGVPQDYAEAVKWYRMAADQGDATAQRNLGRAYFFGTGVSEDSAEAARWYRKAADLGDAVSQYKLGVMYNFGEGVPQDLAVWTWPNARSAATCPNRSAGEEAARWYRKAADQGHAEAQYSLGLMYEVGAELPQDKAEAVKWKRMAANQGHAFAQYSLGFAYMFGKGVPQDLVEAARWFRKAADQGHDDAQYNLGLMYEEGNGLPPERTEAVKWYRRAADQGNANAQHRLDMCEKGKRMPSEAAPSKPKLSRAEVRHLVSDLLDLYALDGVKLAPGNSISLPVKPTSEK